VESSRNRFGRDGTQRVTSRTTVRRSRARAARSARRALRLRGRARRNEAGRSLGDVGDHAAVRRATPGAGSVTCRSPPRWKPSTFNHERQVQIICGCRVARNGRGSLHDRQLLREQRVQARAPLRAQRRIGMVGNGRSASCRPGVTPEPPWLIPPLVAQSARSPLAKITLSSDDPSFRACFDPGGPDRREAVSRCLRSILRALGLCASKGASTRNVCGSGLGLRIETRESRRECP